MAAVRFPKPEVVSSQLWIEIISKFGLTVVTNRSSIKCGRKTANMNVKNVLFYNNM